MKNKTLLVIVPGSDVRQDAVFNLLVAETGETLASHLCSESGFARGDLYYCRPERIEKYKKRFGEVEVKFINETDITMAELQKRNKEWYNNAKKKEYTNE